MAHPARCVGASAPLAGLPEGVAADLPLGSSRSLGMGNGQSDFPRPVSRHLPLGGRSSLNTRKTCQKCGELRSLNDFHKNRGRPDGHTNWCKPCVAINTTAWYARNRERRRDLNLRRYGITGEEYRQLLSEYPTCPACGRSLTDLPSRQVHVDHDHVTGAIRGFLCHGCNTALGLVRESPETLRRLAVYIENAGRQRKALVSQ